MSSSFEEYSQCQRCSKKYEFSSTPALVNTEPVCLQCKIDPRAHTEKWLNEHKLQPLLWNPMSNAWNSIWGVPNEVAASGSFVSKTKLVCQG